MKIISWNVNGIRACAKKGLLDYIKSEDPDIICLQETKAMPTDLPEELQCPPGYHAVWHSGERKGYSGVVTFTKIKPILSLNKIDIPKYDTEGRIVMTEFNNFILFNVYFPNGQQSDKRLQYKLDFYKDFFDICNDLIAQGKNVIICGDYNTAHKEIDLANPKQNEKHSGFLPIEREWIDLIINNGYIDTFREFCSEPDQYTWWTYRFGARKRNIGWRIDYFFVNKGFLTNISDAFIQPKTLGSDHCPVGITIF